MVPKSAHFQWGSAISLGRKIGDENSGSAATLLFAAGRRPNADAVRKLAGNRGGFSVSFDPSTESATADAAAAYSGLAWLELLTNGMTFDLAGLEPGASADQPPCVHAYALPANAEPIGMEALTIRPGPHLSGGHAMPPVVRSLARLAASLSVLDGVEAVAWHAARSWCGPKYFRESVLRWIDGGVFPGLGLTSLAVMSDGGMQSEGLALFTGQELRIEPELMADRSGGAKIGLRLIDYLVRAGRVETSQRISGPDGEPLRLEPSANARFVRVWRG